LKFLLDTEGLIVYRSSPAQKAQIVTFIKQNCKGKSTLAIGDGANDVNMIQSAHVGVGLMGKEGNQASSFADFAIGEFKDLRRLMFWHGSNFGIRLSTFIVLMINKTMITSVAKILFNIYAAGFSGSTYVTELAYVMFAVPITQYGFFNLFEKDVSFFNHSADEAAMPFKMCDHYAHYRDKWIKKIKERFALYAVFTLYNGTIAFYIPF